MFNFVSVEQTLWAKLAAVSVLAMRFMVLIKATKDTEAGVLPDEKLLAEMGKFNGELVKAGVMLAGEGLQPSSKGARVKFSGKKRTVMGTASLRFYPKN